MSPDRPLLELREVEKRYQRRARLFGKTSGEVVALAGVSFAVAPGEVFGLVGESGSGKTTCGRLIVGLERPDSGSILLEGGDITGLAGRELKAFRKKVQMVFQDPYQSLNPQVTIADSVGEPLLTQHEGDANQRLERVLAALKRAGLSPPESHAFRFPHQLSGGQRQRVAIARAMVVEPVCLVADEPTSMLDASYAAQIFDLLLEVRDRLGSAIVFITHSLAAARYLCDRVGVIYRGHLMEIGPAQEVIRNPKHPYTQALLDATPKFGRCEDIPRFQTLLKAERPAAGGAGCAFFRRCRPAHRTRCSVEAPGWRRVSEGHLVACHYAEAGGEPAAGEECRLGGS
jgi:peptide/nickel transport system ATP-binding protein